jgi:hypothetical protein
VLCKVVAAVREVAGTHKREKDYNVEEYFHTTSIHPD